MSNKIIAFIYIAFFCLNLDNYFYSAGYGFEPKYWMMFFLISSIYFCAKKNELHNFTKNKINIFIVIYLTMSAIWYLFNDNNFSRSYAVTLLQINFVLIVSAILIHGCIGNVYKEVTFGMIFALIFGVGSVVLEQIMPDYFMNVSMGIVGRPAGFYLNPNSAGVAIILIMACLLRRVNQKHTSFIVWYSFLGVALSFSRGAMIGWALIVMCAAILNYIPRINFYVIFVLYGLAYIFSEQIIYIFEIIVGDDKDYSNIIDRFSWLVGGSDLSDTSYEERRYISRYALDFFRERPILGNGFGFTWGWGIDVNTHNLFLRHLVEYGIVGIIIFPTLLLCVYKEIPEKEKLWGVCVFASMTVQCFFSHNLIEASYFIIPLIGLQQNYSREL